MSISPPRRHLLGLLLASGFYAALPKPGLALSPAPTASSPAEALVALEQAHGGRLGVYVLDADQPALAFGNRADERFALCSTFKLLLAAVVLREADAGRLDLNATLAFSKADLVPHAPVIEQHLSIGMLSIGALAEAAQKTSDNVAANLLLRELGGPAGFTARLRDLGDTTTRIDRYEPQMNRVLPGELHDTTTPRAMAESVARMFTSDRLSVSAKPTLQDWMIDTKTGSRRLRAGLPPDWMAGDKTGTAYFEGAGNKVNDVAVVWREGRAPLVIAAYLEAADYAPRIRPEDEAVLAEVARIAAAAWHHAR